MFSHAAAAAAGVRGVVFTAAAAGRRGGPVRLGLSYAGFAQISGGNYGLGLGLAVLPGCALTTPQRPACRTERWLDSVNNGVTQTVSARLRLPAGGPLVLAAASAPDDDGGQAGTYSATSLRASGTWAEGGSSGSFTYSYPMAVPPAASSLAPSVSLDYDSGGVDGQTASTQAQASWVGDGWTLGGTAFIEQSFSTCSDAGGTAPASSQDECYDGPVLTLSQDGSSTPLVCPTATFSYTADSTCTLATDDGEVITHHVQSGNGSGTKFTDYWTITDRDGTTYYYGLNQLPGWASGDQATDSVDSVPVFSAHSTDPCHASKFGPSACPMAYRWNLDYVTDVHGNAMAYYYHQNTNAYGEYGSSGAVSYVRDSHLARIDYGFTDGHAYTGHVPDQVVFTSADRCVSGTCDPLNSTNAKNWPDVPYTADYCAAGQANCPAGPTFWSTVRLASVTTQQWNGSSYVTADLWALAQEFPQTGDGTSPALWLDSVTHTGADTTASGGPVPLPAVTFSPEPYQNRLNPNTYVPLNRDRISQITTETGSVISVVYEPTSPCKTNSPPADPSQNALSCFPVYWGQYTGTTTPDWFIKYAVVTVTVSDLAGSPGTDTSYKYSRAAWHYDDNEVIKAKDRTYGQWRGYHAVTTITGASTDPQTESKDTYYQGMDGDPLLNGGTESSTFTDSQGGQHTDSDQLAGDLLESTTYNANNGPVDHSAIYSYWVSAAAATRTRSGLPNLTANATGQVEDWARQAITDTATTTWRETETDTSYDASPSDPEFGLPLFSYRHGDLSDPSQQACTATTYAPPNTSENLTGLVAETETDAVPCGGSNPGGASAPTPSQVNGLTAPTGLNRPAQVISDTRTFYDNPTLAQTWPQPANPTWPQATPTLGDVSVVRQATGYSSGAFSYQTTSATVYDSYGRPVASYDASGNKTTTSYTMTGGVTTSQTVTNPLGQATTTSYDPLRALPLTVTDPNNITTTMQYDALGRVTGVWEYGRPASDPANWKYSYTIDQDPDPTSGDAPAVVTTQQLNTADGYITSTTLYDSLLRVRQTQEPSTGEGVLVTDHFYNSDGWEWKTNTNWWDSSASPGPAILQVNDSQVPDQTVTIFDGLGRPVLVNSCDESAVQSATATGYYGDRVTTVPPTGGTPTSTLTDALGRTTELDSYTSPPTLTLSPATTACSPSPDTTVTVSAGATQATSYSYNTRGELSQIKDASTGQTWTKTYNLLSQVTSTTDPNAGTTTMSYDPTGNLATSTDADGHTISYSYDALNRKTGEYDGPNSTSPPIATWVYDNSSNQPGVTNPIGQLTTETSYDSQGNAYTIQQTGFSPSGESLGETVTLPAITSLGALSGTSYAVTHSYYASTQLPDKDNYLASPGGALPAETVGHQYTTGLDLPAGISSNLADYTPNVTYDPYGQVQQEEIGATSHAYITNSYDPHTGALTDSQTATTSTVDDTSYTYDPAGNITSETDTRNGAESETQCYSYDTLDQLTQAWTATDNCAAAPASNGGATVGDGITGSAYWTTWSYDPLGNRTKETGHSVTGGQNTVTSYSYDGNGASQPDTLTATTATGPGAGSASYSYDADGNTLTRGLPAGNQKLTWADDGKLATDTTSAGTTSYTYDADGNLLLEKDPGQTTVYLFGGTEQITLTGTTLTGTRILPLGTGGEIVRTGAGSNYSYELTNQQGTGVLTLNSSCQNPQWRQYTPYGAPRGTPPPSWPDTNGFLGKPADPDTGLTDLGARQYDPSTGRFLSVDPILDPTSPAQLNGYTYATDNPITDTDPTGQYAAGPPGTGCSTGNESSPICGGHGSGGGGGGGGGSWAEGGQAGGGSDGVDGEYYGGGTAANPDPGQYLLPEPARASYIEWTATWDAPQAIYNHGGVLELLSLNEFCAANPGGCLASFSQHVNSDRMNLTSIIGFGAGAAGMVGRGENIGGPGNSTAADELANADQDLAELACGGQSFTADTRVLLANGKATPIAALEPSDKVLATNIKTGMTTAEPVTAVLIHHDTNLYNLTVKTRHGIAVIQTTRSHLFFVQAPRRWVEAGALNTGASLHTASGTQVTVLGGYIPISKDAWMWDLTVANDHDFYVSAGITAVLVHNCSAGDGGDSIAAQLQAHTDQAAARFDSGEIGLSPAQARAASANPGLEATFRGQVIDSAVKGAVARDPNLASLYITRSGELGPDFLDLNSVPGTPRWYDVTTENSWLTHVARYEDFGEGTGIFYGGG
jgi:RHS repeat-associated protein